jgi:pimeloyl-ACP methyl ester carboxylesterase
LIDAAQLPVLVIWGDADRLICRAVIDHVAERCPDWDLEVLPSVGHVPMLEAPQEFVDRACGPTGRGHRALPPPGAST